MLPAPFLATSLIQTGRLPWLLLSLLILIFSLVIGIHSYLRTRREQSASSVIPELPQDRRDEYLKQALWASGEHFWDYDLVHRRLHRMHAGERPRSGAITVLEDEQDLPPIHEQDLPLVMERLRAHLQGDTPVFASEHRMRLGQDPTWVWIRARGRVVEHGADGSPVRLAGVARDVTNSRRAAYEHRIASEVMRSMGEAVAVLDWEFNFVTVNPSFTRITGYSEAEVRGQPVTVIGSPQNAEDLRARIQLPLTRDGRWSGDVWNARKDGDEVLCRIDANEVLDADGERHLYVLIFNDITDQKRAEQELRYLANYDTLTGLPNRALLSERLSRAVVRARREGGRVAVLFVDLDRFKDINDSLGHATGDRILRAAAARVQQAVGAQHTVARLSGDEFTVIVEGIASHQQAEAVGARVIEAFHAPLAFGERLEMAVSPSIGISLYPDHAQVPSDLLKHADTAMYQAKAAGRHTYQLYSVAMDEKTKHRAILASGLRRALEREELYLVYQPRMGLASQQIVGAEALLRWESREFGSVAPSEFIPLAEETGLILEIGTWTLRQACQTLVDWHAQGRSDLSVSVNVSALQLQRGDLSRVLETVIAETGVDPRRLELELTESTIMANPAKNADTLRACRQLGVALAIDDFGTGYSSLSYLKRLPLTTLKIDQEFVRDLTHNADDQALTQIIINMSRSLGLNVVAEGVEHAGQLALLQANGCDEVQGHYISRALPGPECLAFILEYSPGTGHGALPLTPPARTLS
ncbi:putative bifunctional diguanylate cyclase/phosphodiesterase [Pseudoxanthomonas composti]|uniref:EAL domain-containing protein n=1 Tax=Pseudoxanthomonas composti TaxID=2137479 RepID=A0A4Q1JU15_9GAMM|nr:GGDEF domain-containing phosphodiesterase [Pseudoxanthomonas composti]RXR04242.1 EAL domain-containing protein [Pseudoxanthomonas composti]